MLSKPPSNLQSCDCFGIRTRLRNLFASVGAHNSMQEHDAERADAQRHMQLPNVCKELDGQRMALSRQSMVYVHHALDAKITQSLLRKRGNARGPPGSRLAR